MLYTRKGDDGTTKTFGCNQRVSKSSAIAEALGGCDEINSLLGLCKVKSKEAGFVINSKKFSDIIHTVQQNLFIVQAQLAGADKKISQDKITEIEAIIDSAENELPPIKTFFISGGSELGALFDYARTIARRAERRVVLVNEEKMATILPETLSYLNRLSSLFYALARLSNHKYGIKEEPPSYD